MENDTIDYSLLVQEAMYSVVKQALKIVIAKGYLPEEHHFYITFLTKVRGVAISESLKTKYPEAMTIVIQHQFEDLEVKNDYFAVSLMFSGVKEKLIIPFKSIVSFSDPIANFAVQFDNVDEESIDEKDGKNYLKGDYLEENSENVENDKLNNIVILDNFRNKKK